jgi:N utilization substance protein A
VRPSDSAASPRDFSKKARKDFKLIHEDAMDDEPTFGSAIDQIVEEKGISKEKVLETIEAALAAAYRKDYGERGQDIRVEFNEDDGTARVYKVMTVSEFPEGSEMLENPAAQLTLEDARKTDSEAEVGKEYVEDVTPNDPHYGRVAAQTAKQVIIQRIREAEREATYEEYKEKEGEIISGIVQRVEGEMVFVDIGRTTGILPPGEQVRGERYRVNQRIRVYVVKVDLSSRDPEILLSRSHPGMLRRLFELEVPEVFAGSVEIKAIAREASERSKVAVWATEEGIDPVGACIGQRGTRIQTIIAELSGEKIDIIQWDEDPARYITNALSPARIVAVDVFEEEKRAVAHVEEYQLSLAIGKRGQNVRLAAKLSGWRIDIVKAGEEGEEKEAVEAGAGPEEKPAEALQPETSGGEHSADTPTESSTEEQLASEASDPTIQKDENPSASEGSEEAAMDPAEKEQNAEGSNASEGPVDR